MWTTVTRLKIKKAHFLLLILLWSAAFSLKAQNNDGSIIFQSSRKNISATNEELTDLTVKIINHTERILDATLNVSLDKNLNLVSKNNLLISLKPGDSTYVPLKIFITQKAQSGKDHVIGLFLKDQENKVLAKDECHIQVVIKKSVTLFAMASNILLESNTDSIRIPIRVSNTGNTAQKITIISRYPSIVENGDFHTAMQFIIPASKDTLLTFTKAVNSRMFPSDGFDVNITGLYANGELFGMAYIQVQNARNNRYYRDQSLNDSYDNNSISLSSQSLFAQNQSYLLTGRGIIELPAGKVGYNIDATTYKNSYYSPTMVRNTYLSYEAYNAGIKAGNINRNLDINLSGRGGAAFVNDTAAHNLYEGGYINSSTNLLGNSFSGFYKTGQAAWGSFMHTTKKWQLSSAALYELNPMLGASNIIAANEFSFVTAKKFRYLLTLNGGRTSEYEHQDNSRYGYAAGITANGNIGKVILSSTNYISSGYYPGTRRGAMNFSERVTWGRPSGNTWGSVDYYKYKPKYFSNVFSFDPSYSSLRAEIGISEKIFKHVTLSFSPYYSIETNNSFQFLTTTNLENAQNVQSFLRSWNIVTALNIPLSAAQYISVNTEAGLYNSSLDPVSRFHFRSNSSYRYGFFNVMASLQTGTFYMGEAVSNYTRKTGSNYLINITPSFQKSFFRNKLRTEMGLTYSNTKISGKSWQLTGRTEYNVFQQTSLFAAVNHNRYTFIEGHYNSSVVEVGITKKMRSARLGTKNATMEVFVFKDINQNGIYDQGDSVANNSLIYINDIIFMTRSDGTVIYKNLPPGDYRISLPKLKDWYAPEQRINFSKHERIEIPIHKTGTLKGSISYSYSEFSYEVGRQVEGIVVTAVSDNGQSYITRTNVDGNYIFFIPVGRYTVSINTENLPAEVECKNSTRLTEITSGAVKLADLVLNIKQRKIETRKFLSPSLKR